MKKEYRYCVFEGDARTVGREQARLIKSAGTGAAAFFGSPFPGHSARLAEAERLLRMNEAWCPALNAEIEGFAAELGAEPEAVVWYTATIPRSANCSQFAVLPDRSAAGGTICGRSYEWSFEDELTLKTVRADGSYAHTGFSIFAFGRLDGLNEKGLWISMTAGNPGPAIPETEGFRFWALVRTILDRAADVDEAVAIASAFPLAFEAVFLAADSRGNAALIEKGPERQEIRRVREGTLASTNHFALPGMAAAQPEVFEHSILREKHLARTLAGGSLSLAGAERALASSFPDGLSAHFYGEGFGTLWASCADLSSRTLRVCFGPPDVPGNQFRSFCPSDPVGVSTFSAELPEEAAAAAMWRRVPRKRK